MARIIKTKTKKAVRARFAPSPTGFLHIGGARTCLFNYLFAKKHKGVLLLRIEDTDQKRSKKDYEQDILEGLKWLGLTFDEGPYYQSQRRHIYNRLATQLIEQGNAYFCFCSQEELKANREYQLSVGQAPRYSGKCRQIEPAQAAARVKAGERAIVRLMVSAGKIKFKDVIRGNIEFGAELLGDFAIAKVHNDSFLPLYNFAVVADDKDMQISHVIRGEEHLSNTPKQILIYQAFGWPPPIFAHLPLILATDRSKLSKRRGASAVNDFKAAGYMPEALLNFVALLGWSPGDNREIFTLKELVKEFSLERVQKSGAVFNRRKLDALNGFYIRQKELPELTQLCLPYLLRAGLIKADGAGEQQLQPFGAPTLLTSFTIKATDQVIEVGVLQKIVGLYQERLKKLSEINELTDFFFLDLPEYPKEMLNWQKTDSTETKKILENIVEILSQIPDNSWQAPTLQEKLLALADLIGDRGKVLWPARVALSGKEASAPFFDIAEILGKEKTLKRLKYAIAKL